MDEEEVNGGGVSPDSTTNEMDMSNEGKQEEEEGQSENNSELSGYMRQLIEKTSRYCNTLYIKHYNTPHRTLNNLIIIHIWILDPFIPLTIFVPTRACIHRY
eukprot:sb/3478318/